ncbi:MULTISPECIES: hypothetical protein [unclassified Bradyrhizobium]|uniref:hypothetical protein n=1 Tax=unclassified Bradyrhizobium TaxID=2631580 RepID=UPI00291660BB|nr:MULTISPECIES: hypothetical protein [unclassified Bradyrhizobium]
MTPVRLDDQSTWPQIGSIWSHYNGNLYEVVLFTNVDSTRPDRYPTTIVHRNILNGKYYSRKLTDWDRSMTQRIPLPGATL